MPPAPPVLTRLAALACALAVGAALVLSACGEDRAATAGGAARAAGTTGPSPGARPPQRSEAPAAAACPAQLDAFVDSLERLRRRLAVGLSYEQYAAAVKALRAAYDRVPIHRLDLGCLSATGTPAERALNEYVDAANAWGRCLADAGCTSATIEPDLQRRWRVASHHLSEAR